MRISDCCLPFCVGLMCPVIGLGRHKKTPGRETHLTPANNKQYLNWAFSSQRKVKRVEEEIRSELDM